MCIRDRFDQSQYGDIVGNLGVKITGKITIIGINNDGTFTITDKNGLQHNDIKLPDNMKPSL